MPYCEKKIYSGELMEVEIYPIYPSGREMPGRKDKSKDSSKAQKNLNDKNARKNFVRLVNANFTQEDIAVHGTYRDDEMPCTEKEVRRDITNYIRRIKNRRKRHGLPSMKYIYVIECKVSKRTGILRWHFHMIMSAIDRDIAERLWRKGDWVNSKRLQPNDFGFEALARYMVKDPQGSRRWSGSKNLKKPFIRQRDNAITRLGAQRMATKHVDDREYFEKKYKGYRFLVCDPVFNEINGHWYISISMRRKAKNIPRGKPKSILQSTAQK